MSIRNSNLSPLTCAFDATSTTNSTILSVFKTDMTTKVCIIPKINPLPIHCTRAIRLNRTLVTLLQCKKTTSSVYKNVQLRLYTLLRAFCRNYYLFRAEKSKRTQKENGSSHQTNYSEKICIYIFCVVYELHWLHSCSKRVACSSLRMMADVVQLHIAKPNHGTGHMAR